jgi:multiple antibiotic resistance protein
MSAWFDATLFGGIVLLARIAGLLLPAIAVQLVADSVRGFVAEG